MNVAFKEKIQTILGEGVGINLFFALKQKEGKVKLKKADLEDGDTQELLLRQFVSMLQEDFINNEDLTIMEMSEADERNNVFYHYDLSEFPESFQYFSEFQYSEDYEMFSFAEDSLIDLDAYLIVIGSQENHCVLYKKFYPVFLLGRGSFCLIPSRKRFKKLEDEVLRVNRDYQYILVENEIYIKNLDVLERYGAFKEIIEKEAASAVKKIEELQILEETEVLTDTLTTDIAFARKLCKIGKSSPVLKLHIPNRDIIKFSKTHPGIKGVLKYNQSGDKILLTTKNSQKVFLKMMEDSYLVSELTKLYYDSMAKEQIMGDSV